MCERKPAKCSRSGELEAGRATRAKPQRPSAATVPRSAKPTTSRTIPARVVSSPSGKAPHGAGGRVLEARRGAAARSARRRRGGAGARGSASRCARSGAQRACGCGGPWVEAEVGGRMAGSPRPANGQPEESLTCHQPISIPIRPRRGRTCQAPQPGYAESARGERARSGGGRARAACARAARGPRASRAARSASVGAAPRAAARRGRRAAPRARRGPAGAGRRGAGHGDVERRVREAGGQRVGELALEPRDLAAQRAARGGLVDRSAQRDRRAALACRGGRATCDHGRISSDPGRPASGTRRTVQSASSTWIAGTPGAWTQNSRVVVRLAGDQVAGGQRAEEDGDRPRASATTSRPAGSSSAYSCGAEPLAGARRAQPQRAVEALLVERPTRARRSRRPRR